MNQIEFKKHNNFVYQPHISGWSDSKSAIQFYNTYHVFKIKLLKYSMHAHVDLAFCWFSLGLFICITFPSGTLRTFHRVDNFFKLISIKRCGYIIFRNFSILCAIQFISMRLLHTKLNEPAVYSTFVLTTSRSFLNIFFLHEFSFLFCFFLFWSFYM